jgi:hypothetical protein
VFNRDSVPVFGKRLNETKIILRFRRLPRLFAARFPPRMIYDPIKHHGLLKQRFYDLCTRSAPRHLPDFSCTAPLMFTVTGREWSVPGPVPVIYTEKTAGRFPINSKRRSTDNICIIIDRSNRSFMDVQRLAGFWSCCDSQDHRNASYFGNPYGLRNGVPKTNRHRARRGTHRRTRGSTRGCDGARTIAGTRRTNLNMFSMIKMQ